MPLVLIATVDGGRGVRQTRPVGSSVVWYSRSVSTSRLSGGSAASLGFEGHMKWAEEMP